MSYIPEPVARYKGAYSYLVNPFMVHLRNNKNVKKSAIRMSAAAPTERQIVAKVCARDAEVLGLEGGAYPYHERVVTEYVEPNGLEAGYKWQACMNML